MGVQQNMRVRHISSELSTSPITPETGGDKMVGSARIELDAEFLQRLSYVDGGERLQKLAEEVSQLGFINVAFQPFRSGGVAAVRKKEANE